MRLLQASVIDSKLAKVVATKGENAAIFSNKRSMLRATCNLLDQNFLAEAFRDIQFPTFRWAFVNVLAKLTLWIFAPAKELSVAS